MLYLATDRQYLDGFTVEPGYLVLEAEDGQVMAVSSGWRTRTALYVYTQEVTGGWSGAWISAENGWFPIEDAFCLLDELYEKWEYYHDDGGYDYDEY